MNLLELSRKTIEEYLKGNNFEPDQKIKEKFSGKKACFVTLTKKGKLCGCIGSLIARQELWKDIIDNSINAAFNDPRFHPISEKELDEIQIEISILSKPKEVKYNSDNELKQLIKNKGIFLSDGFYSATYLPQVWEDLPEPEKFLSSLCMKAGLNSNAWKNKKLKIQVYDVEKIKEVELLKEEVKNIRGTVD
jgi:AmmeMemoRadiSam system protein A